MKLFNYNCIRLKAVRYSFYFNYMNRLFSLLILQIILYGCSDLRGTKAERILEGKDIIADSGMVVSAHHLCSLAGVKVLQEGGNAVDAAVATGFALAVCYPEAGNIGGGGFMLARLKDGKSVVIDFREKAPLHSSRDMFLDKSGNVEKGISTDTHLASGVPGTVDGLITAHDMYGSLSFDDVIQPAIDLAEKGFILTVKEAANLNFNRETFLKRNKKGISFVKDSLWNEGDTLIQKDLAETLRRIRDKGRDGFYKGKTAELIVREMKKGNGIISEDDLSQYKSVLRQPLRATYKGYDIITVPPPSGGGITLIQLLEMIEPYPLKEWGFHSPGAIHLMVEAERRAFADRSEYPGDPDFVSIPIKELISMKYIERRMASFSETRASSSSDIKAGSPGKNESSETTHYSVVDKDGNAVSVTTTLNGSFGNSIVVDSAGFLLNNEMDDFSVKPGFPNMYGLVGGEANSVQSGKRMLSSMTPTIIEKENKLFMVLGSPGGSTIPTTVFQVIVNVIDYDMSLGQAVSAKRFHHQWLPDYISYEREAIDSLTLIKLKDMGHQSENSQIIRTDKCNNGVEKW